MEKKLRVYAIRNVPDKPSYWFVDTPEEAKVIIKKQIEKDLKDDSIESNVFGLQELSKVDGELQNHLFYFVMGNSEVVRPSHMRSYPVCFNCHQRSDHD